MSVNFGCTQRHDLNSASTGKISKIENNRWVFISDEAKPLQIFEDVAEFGGGLVVVLADC